MGVMGSLLPVEVKTGHTTQGHQGICVAPVGEMLALSVVMPSGQIFGAQLSNEQCLILAEMIAATAIKMKQPPEELPDNVVRIH